MAFFDERLGGWLRHLSTHSANTQRGYISDLKSWCGAAVAVKGVEPDAGEVEVPAQASARVWVPLVQASRVVSLEEVTAGFCSDVIAELSVSRSGSSVARVCAAVTSYFDWLVLHEFLESNPMRHAGVKRPRKGKTLPRAVPQGHVEKILKVIQEPDQRRRRPWPERDLAAASLLIGAGLRANEVCTVRWGDLSEIEGSWWLRVSGKGSKERSVPLSPEVLHHLDRYRLTVGERGRDGTGGETVLARDDGKDLSTRVLRDIVGSWYSRAGVAPGYKNVVHAFRHHFATSAVAGGAPLQDVQDLLGHSSLETTRVYLSVTSDSLLQTVSSHTSRGLLKGEG